jgi:hypothetical protein
MVKDFLVATKFQKVEGECLDRLGRVWMTIRELGLG